MKKVITFLVSATMVLLMFTGCPNAGNSNLPDDVVSASDAFSLYNNLLGAASNDLLNPGNLVVYDKNNKATEIEQSNNSRATETSTWQPLKKDVTVINPRDEILFCSSLDYSLTLKQDKGNNYSSKTLATMSTCSCDRMVGDYDNDGLDEVCIFYSVHNDSENIYEIQYNIYDNDSLSALAKLDTQNANALLIGASVVGDYDGDGKDEIIVPIGSSLFLYDYENSSLTLKQKYDFTGYQFLNITSGDYDGDGISDFILRVRNTSLDTYGYRIFSGVFNVFGQFGSIIKDEIVGGNSYWAVDVDADGCDEFCVNYYKNLNYYLNTYKISKSTIALLSEKSTGINEQICDIVDINGDLSPELITVDTSGGHNYKMYYEQKFDGKYYSAKDLSLIRTFGDIDDNGTTDLISLSSDGKQIVVYGYNNLTKAFEKLHTYDLGGAAAGFLIAGNFDNDSSRVQFVSHELCFSEPIVRAVIASVPYYEGLVGTENYDPSGWNTGYEISKTTSSSFENEEGFHVKISGGAEFKVLGNGAKFDLSLDNSFKWACSSSMSVGSSVGYYNGGGENLVVFTAAPVDVYSYKILACPYDESLVGTTTTINIPRKVSTYSTELNYYNAHNGSFKDIPDTVFTHTVGVPSSYLSNEAATTFINDNYGFISPSSSGVSISDTGSSSFSLSYETEETKTFTHEEARDVSVEVAASGVTGGLEAGFAFGLSWSDSIIKGNTFTGTVGNIPLSIGANGNYPTYTSGLYVYKKVVLPGGSELVLPPEDSVLEEYIQRCEGLVFWVVDYFVN